ncbi:hypothetical protein [Niveibacterium sp.]|uniref:hypothetical protein n=1 Tax=Niveibacterium sp. TaxID=2017444 RepID=UPI0035B33D9B
MAHHANENLLQQIFSQILLRAVPDQEGQQRAPLLAEQRCDRTLAIAAARRNGAPPGAVARVAFSGVHSRLVM